MSASAVSRGRVDVREGGVPELVRPSRRATVSVAAAADIATLPREEQREIVARCDDREVLRRALEIRAVNAGAAPGRAASKASRDYQREAPICRSAGSGRSCSQTRPTVTSIRPSSSSSATSRSTTRRWTLEEICALPVAQIATENALLFLCVPTSPLLEQAFRVSAGVGGFQYRTGLVWDKISIGIGKLRSATARAFADFRARRLPNTDPTLRQPSIFTRPPRRAFAKSPTSPMS